MKKLMLALAAILALSAVTPVASWAAIQSPNHQFPPSDAVG